LFSEKDKEKFCNSNVLLLYHNKNTQSSAMKIDYLLLYFDIGLMVLCVWFVLWEGGGGSSIKDVILDCWLGPALNLEKACFIMWILL
jgi:hypothetical protein